jgi:putative oxidoreductase
MTTRFKNRLVWALSVLAALLFIAAGASKVSGEPHTAANFIGWGFSDSFRIFVGVCELLGAASLLVPPFTALGASGLSIIMLGAVFTHLSHEQAIMAPLPLALLFLVLFLAYARRGDVGKLYGHAAAVTS